MLINCPKCGQEKEADEKSVDVCVECAAAERQRSTYLQVHKNDDWLEIAKDSGLEPWVQQPGETQWEYTVWCAYRDSYPGKKPSYQSVADQLDTTPTAVRHISQRWTFPVRMQLWVAHCDEITLCQRRQEILDMNKQHIDMAAKLNEKLNIAIDCVDATNLKPGEVVSLAKLATELERKARVDTVAQEAIMRHANSVAEETGITESKKTKTSDLDEVISILIKAGALGNVGDIGIKQTTEVVLRKEPDNE